MEQPSTEKKNKERGIFIPVSTWIHRRFDRLHQTTWHHRPQIAHYTKTQCLVTQYVIPDLLYVTGALL